MLRIREAQMAILSEAAEARFERELVSRTRRAQPDSDEDAARAFVRAVLARADEWGIDEEDDARRLLEHCLALGLGFEERKGLEELRATLADPHLPGFAKLDVVEMELAEGVT